MNEKSFESIQQERDFDDNFPETTYRIIYNTLRICRDKGISLPGVEKGIGRPVGYISDFTKDIEHDTNLTVDDAYKISLLIGETLPDLIERDYTIEKIHRDMEELGFKGKKSRKKAAAAEKRPHE